MTIDALSLRRVLSHLATGVTAVATRHRGGDHAILVARILSAGRDEGLPLVFFESRYTTTAGDGPA